MFDQITSWITVILCLWIVHQTAQERRTTLTLSRSSRVGLFLMRGGIAMLGLSIAVISLFRIMDVVFIAGGVWKTALNAMLIGVVIFHKDRFGRV